MRDLVALVFLAAAAQSAEAESLSQEAFLLDTSCGQMIEAFNQAYSYGTRSTSQRERGIIDAAFHLSERLSREHNTDESTVIEVILRACASTSGDTPIAIALSGE